jgi:hypothetical protein
MGLFTGLWPKRKSSPPAATAPQVAPSPSVQQVIRVRNEHVPLGSGNQDIPGGVSDETLHRLTQDFVDETGRAPLHLERMLDQLAKVNIKIIGKEFRATVLGLIEKARGLERRAPEAKRKGITAIRHHGNARVKRVHQKVRTRRDGLKEVQIGFDRLLIVLFVGLFAADTTVFVVSYEVLPMQSFYDWFLAIGTMTVVAGLGHRAGVLMRHSNDHTIALNSRTAAAINATKAEKEENDEPDDD